MAGELWLCPASVADLERRLGTGKENGSRRYADSWPKAALHKDMRMR